VPAPALVAVVVVAVAAIAAACRPVIADRHAHDGVAALDHPSLEVYGDFAAASNWLGLEPAYHRQQAAALTALAAEPSTDPALRRSLLDEALLAYDHALDRAPGDVPTLEAQADVHLLAAEAAERTEDADRHIASAVAILRRIQRDVRADDELHLPLARAYELRARLGSGDAAARDRKRAAAEFERARAYTPDRLAALTGLARIAVDEGRYEAARDLLVAARELAPDDPDLEAAADEVDRRLREGG
jgi:hypothetical protein